MTNQKHLTPEERNTIELRLSSGCSFKVIGQELGKDCTTISKEVRKHKVFKKSGSYGKPFKDCAHRFDCDKAFLCGEHSPCRKLSCKFCPRCLSVCKDYQKQSCVLLEKPPYVCNACADRLKCTLEKAVYSASAAQKGYITVLSESREGISLSETETARIDGILMRKLSD